MDYSSTMKPALAHGDERVVDHSMVVQLGVVASCPRQP
jgi:hypothetical protein